MVNSHEKWSDFKKEEVSPFAKRSSQSCVNANTISSLSQSHSRIMILTSRSMLAVSAARMFIASLEGGARLHCHYALATRSLVRPSRLATKCLGAKLETVVEQALRSRLAWSAKSVNQTTRTTARTWS